MLLFNTTSFLKYVTGCIVLLLVVTACEPVPKSTPNETTDGHLPTQEIEDFTVIETKKGRKKYEARANYAAIYRDESEIVATDLFVTFFDRQGVGFSTLKADTGYIDDMTKDMRAVGDVVVVTQDSARLESEELVWDHQDEKIRSGVFVKITRGQDVLTGIGLETDPNLNQIDIKKDVKASVIEVNTEGL